MLFPKFYVYPEDQDLVVKCIQLLKGYGFECFVDSKNKDNLEWLNQNNSGPHRFYVFVGGEIIPVEVLTDLSPFLLIAYNAGDEVNDEDWEEINHFIDDIVYGKTPVIKNRLAELLNPPAVQSLEASPLQVLDATVKPTSYYTYAEEEVKGCRYFEFSKGPDVDPFTIVMYDFEDRGYPAVFAALMRDSQWGLSAADYPFLKKVWDHVDMKEDFEPEKILADYAAASLPGENGPGFVDLIVARKSIEEVKEMQVKRRRGIYLRGKD
jgi:hypothetical protein